MHKKLAIVIISSFLLCGGTNVQAAPSFFAAVPATDWSYAAVNELIRTGNIKEYQETIPEGRVMSRLEMAMIVSKAQKNMSAFSEVDQNIILKLNAEYLYDLKKLEVLEKIDKLEESKATEKQSSALEVKSAEKKPSPVNISGYVRNRVDYEKIGDKASNSHSSNIYSYIKIENKINDNWTVGLVNESYQWLKTATGLDSTIQPGNSTDLYFRGPFLHTEATFGKFNLFTNGGFIADSKVSGMKMEWGDKLKYNFTIGHLENAEDLQGAKNYYPSTGGAPSYQAFTVNYPIAPKSNIAAEVHRMTYGGKTKNFFELGYNTPIAENVKFVGLWGKGDSTVDDTGSSGYVTTLQFREIHPMKAGSWDTYVKYFHLPRNSNIDTTYSWWNGKRGPRIGVDYVIDKNFTVGAMYDFQTPLDGSEKVRAARLEMYLFF
ncbi:hypothetical protein P22_2119 [Propionispora sp. 2/2-37]|uniref:hypothetical protein n=1 Tax=Propionispora sp. 2/2-37 TaxID=1677858 RepID=UPI0006BB78F1|nr:hypothetical protein [Propionispora sp. 2/2-37]CUH96031.1 hypothetical protein P22_2119 [Propionispora sp. 2/2-37]